MFAARFLRTATRSFTTSTRSQRHSFFQRSQHCPLQNTPPKWRSQSRHYARQSYNYQRFPASGNILQRWAARPTFYYEVGGAGALCGGYYIYNLETVPVSGRRRFMVVSEEREQATGKQMYEETLQEFHGKILPPYTKEHQMVQQVLDRLIPHSGLAGESWEVHVIDDPLVNAFVIPGGKVFVFRGILDVCAGEAGLAAVLGHEIAHNVAHHQAERMSQAVVLLPLGIVAWIAAGVDPYIFRMATNLALTLPGSRRQEEEADYIGLLMMAESCYDPEAAVALWSRMQAQEEGEPPQFLSTHPSNHNRLEKLRGWQEEAKRKRENSECAEMFGYADGFRNAAFQRW